MEGLEQTNAWNYELHNLQRGMAGNFRDVQDVCPRTDSNMVMSNEGMVGSDGSIVTQSRITRNEIRFEPHAIRIGSHEVVIRKTCYNMLADARRLQHHGLHMMHSRKI